jgi:hypothetical protein
LVFIDQQWAPTALANHQIKHPLIAKIGGDHTPTIPIMIRTREVADFQKGPSLTIEENPIPLKTA